MPKIPEIPMMPALQQFGHRGLLGIDAEALNSQLAGYFGVKEGVLVRSVMRNSAAGKAGVRAGDVIVKVDGEAVASQPEIISALMHAARAGKTFPVVVVRDKKELTLPVTLESGAGGMRGLRPVSLPERSS
jgi:serine protease Do